MALQLNLLHEQIAEQRQRQRDPLKIGMMALATIGAFMLIFYVFKAYQTLQIKNHLTQVQHDWAKVEPKVTAAQTRSKELTATIGTTKVLDTIVEGRFFWAPLLQKLSQCVAPNAQLMSVDGTVGDDSKTVALSIQGLAAGREARGAAEELRQLLSEQLSQSYSEVKVEFKTLEDLDNIINVGGANMAIARYSIDVTLNSTAEAPKAETNPTRNPKK